MSSGNKFVHLHVHTDYSRLDGMSKVEGVAQRVHEFGQEAFAITDHGNTKGWVKAMAKAKELNLQFIPGLEAYHVDDVKVKGQTVEGKANYHLILLAVTNEGYRNLMKISSIANTRENTYYGRPRIDNNILRRYSEGIVCTSSCLGGSVAQALLTGDKELAVERATELRDIFGADRFFIEIQDHGIADQHKILDDQVWLAKEIGVGLVAAQDSHYDHPSDYEAHDAMLAMQTGSNVDDPDRFRFEGDQHYLKSSEEMIELFPEDRFPGAIENTVKIANMAKGLTFPYKTGEYLLPHFPVPEGFDTEDEYLRHVTYEGLDKKYADEDGSIPKRIIEQAEHELAVISEMGFPGYFLILSDCLTYIKTRGHRVGDGRGSAAGSLVAYATNITNVPPNEHGLYFERFLNPGRRSMPDIDVDLTESGRDELVAYAQTKFGFDSVAKIGTIGTLKAKSVIKSTLKVMGFPTSTGKMLTSLYPSPVSQVDVPLWVVMEDSQKNVDERFRRQWRDGSNFRSEVNSDPELRKAIDIAIKIEGINSSPSMHAGGLLITPGPVDDFFPTREDPATGILVTEYDLYDVEALGGVKIDFLGLKNLSLIDRAIELIRDDLGIDINTDNIPFDDQSVYSMIADGDTEGVFQMSQDGMRATARAVRPTSFSDISAILALYRPGPMSMNTHMEYADRKNGRKPVESLHPDMMDILSETYGLVVYQEQVMALARHFAGYTLAESDDFRRAMGKKDADAMEEQHEKFLEGVSSNGFTKELAQQLWDIIEPFSGYAFNKSHSVAYGFITYYTAYLKRHYPAQYAAAIIEYMGEDDVSAQIDSARRQGVEVYSPNINMSRAYATTSKNSIWLGMSGIKHCGLGPIESIVRERERGGQYKSLADFLVRTRDLKGRVTKKNIEGLIYSGAFDTLHPSRKVMIENLEDMIADAKLVSTDIGFDSDSIFDMSEMGVGNAVDEYDLSSTEDYSNEERVRFELEYLGFFAGQHPFIDIQPRIEDAVLTGVIPEDAVEPDPEILTVDHSQVYGIMSELDHHKSKNGRLRSSFVIETSHSKRVQGVVFGFHLSDSLKGSFVLAEGSIKINVDDVETENEQSGEEDASSIKSFEIIATKVSRINIDRASEDAPERRRRALRAIPGDRAKRRKAESAPKVEEKSSEPVAKVDIGYEESTYTEDDSPMIFNDYEPPKPMEVPDGQRHYRFHVVNRDDLSALSELLTSYGKGDSQVHIRYEGSDVTHEGMRFNLTDHVVDEVASRLSIKWEEVPQYEQKD